MGVLHVKPKELLDWSIIDVVDAYNAYWHNDRINWERARFTAYLSASPNLPRGTTLMKFHTFGWEKKQSNFTKDELNKFKEQIKKHKPHWTNEK